MTTTPTLILNLTLSIPLQPTTWTFALIPHRKNISTQTLTTTRTRTLIQTPSPTPNHDYSTNPLTGLYAQHNWNTTTTEEYIPFPLHLPIWIPRLVSLFYAVYHDIMCTQRVDVTWTSTIICHTYMWCPFSPSISIVLTGIQQNKHFSKKNRKTLLSSFCFFFVILFLRKKKRLQNKHDQQSKSYCRIPLIRVSVYNLCPSFNLGFCI